MEFKPGHWEGLDGLGDEALNELRTSAEDAVRDAVVMLSGAIKETLSGARTGRAYRVSRTGRLHIASAPGEPPAVLYGNLRNSVGYSPPSWDATAASATVSAEVGVGLGQKPTMAVDPENTYARRMELGGVDSRGVRILPRPYMEPTMVRMEPRVDELLERTVQ
jgi:hypothetical protein